MKYLLLIVSIILMSCSIAYASPGGVDSNGCHTGSSGHHCHAAKEITVHDTGSIVPAFKNTTTQTYHGHSQSTDGTGIVIIGSIIGLALLAFVAVAYTSEALTIVAVIIAFILAMYAFAMLGKNHPLAFVFLMFVMGPCVMLYNTAKSATKHLHKVSEVGEANTNEWTITKSVISREYDIVGNGKRKYKFVPVKFEMPKPVVKPTKLSPVRKGEYAIIGNKVLR